MKTTQIRFVSLEESPSCFFVPSLSLSVESGQTKPRREVREESTAPVPGRTTVREWSHSSWVRGSGQPVAERELGLVGGQLPVHLPPTQQCAAGGFPGKPVLLLLVA